MSRMMAAYDPLRTVAAVPMMPILRFRVASTAARAVAPTTPVNGTGSLAASSGG